MGCCVAKSSARVIPHCKEPLHQVVQPPVDVASSSSGDKRGSPRVGGKNEPALRGAAADPCGRPTWEQFTSFETYIFDCDGVIWGIDKADTATSVTTINYLIGLGKRVMFITNNSNKRRAEFLKQLESKGIVFTNRTMEEKLGMMISASYTTAKYLQGQGLKHPFVIASATGLLEELRLAGVTQYFATVDDKGVTDPTFTNPSSLPYLEIANIVQAHPEVDSIVMGWDDALTARKLATAVNFIRFHEDAHKDTEGFKPLPIVSCSGDASGALGTANVENKPFKVRAVGNGAMAESLSRCFDPPREWVDMGKPSDSLLALLAGPAYGVDVSKALMVGDTLQTDIVFGNRGKMSTLLVFTGVTTKLELEEAQTLDDPRRLPTYAVSKLGFFVDQGKIPLATA
uniref:4-nitrophenylphosphatase n=1 Tax=Zooxanthella nutricula TaxID=1333877 RepID=A0A7S2N7T8_9DINO|mmetsp:Transcript_20102/g.60182  ORF Transcript_20102/g.60182 Transcript_20102/m.60182 type:complete len:400 (+) Transcript_20102:187-1386(+)